MEAMRLPISKSQRGKLISAGYTSLSSLSSVSPSDLARDLRISENEATGILKVASPSTRLDSTNRNHSVINGAQTAWDMLREEELCTPISTSCAELDDILGGGIHCKEVTEIGGVPGVGKTQLGIQLAVNVQIPIDFGGLGGKAMYIDSEGSFMPERALQIAEACVEDMLARDGNLKKNFQASQFQMQPRDFLENIIRIGVCSYTELIAVINQLERFISKDEDVRLVIIDSITFYFRQDFDDMALRTRLLSAMALKLMKLAKKHNVAVVILNQATAKISDSSFRLTLALGDTWSHACTNRVILYWNGDDRYAYIDKSPSLQSASAPYSVTHKGIRSLAAVCKRIKMMQAVD